MVKFLKFLSVASLVFIFTGCFEGKKELACDDKNIQNSVKKLIKPHLGDLFGAAIYQDEINSNKAAKDIINNLSTGFALKQVLKSSHVKQKFDSEKECDKDNPLCKIIKASDKFNEKSDVETVALDNFKILNKEPLLCSADIGLKDIQKIMPDINATNLSKISTVDYEVKLTEDKKQIRVEIKRL
ncbi:hypothetical protein [Campylobacter sp.]|uniref:hypothetical protein n=1 Tax=Campylobacter sp. TaxID=205 RepID=UPI0026F56209|nr:hypothetical protein [Campylobacter sp.]